MGVIAPASPLVPAGQGPVQSYGSGARSTVEGYDPAILNVSKLLPIDHFNGLHTAYADIASGQGAAPFKTVAELVAYAKANPGKLNYSTGGAGTLPHLTAELFKKLTGTEITHVPYKGVGPALQDTLAGHVMSMVSNAASAKPQIDAGKLRALGVTSLKRSAALPDVPTFDEQGVKGYEVLNWFGLFAPAGTPKEIVDRLQAEAAAMMNDPKTREMLTGEGAEPVVSKPEVFAAFVRDEIKKWDEVGKAANIQPTE